MKWYPQACPVCGGDLHDDIQDSGWVTCFMCARTFRRAQALRPRSLEDTQPLPIVAQPLTTPNLPRVA